MSNFKPDIPLGDSHVLHQATTDGMHEIIFRVKGTRYWLPPFASPQFLTGARCCPVCYSPLPKVEAPDAQR